MSQPTYSATHIINDKSIKLFSELLAEIDWTPISISCQKNDPNLAYNNFIDLVKEAYNHAFPLVSRKRKSDLVFKQPWMTKALLKSCRKRAKLYLKFVKQPNDINKRNFVTYRNKFKSLRIKAERDYYAAEFSRYNNDIKRTWRTIRTLLNTDRDESKIDYLCVNGIKN